MEHLIRQERESQAALEKLEAAYEAYDKAKVNLEISRASTQAALAEAYDAGVTMAVLRDISGLTRQRIHQIIEFFRLENQILKQRLESEAWAKRVRDRSE